MVYFGVAGIRAGTRDRGAGHCFLNAGGRYMKGALERITQWFSGYVDGLRRTGADLNDAAFELKRAHSHRVAHETAQLAASLSLSAYERGVAQLLGLVHDVGRFEQIAHHNTFNDGRSVNHAELGARVLEEHRALDDLEQPYREAVVCAVRNHNLPSLPPGLGGLEKTFSQMIRDADKLDIYHITTGYFSKPVRDRVAGIELGLVDSGEISPQVYELVKAGKAVPYAMLTTTADFRMVQMGWVSDIHYDYTLRSIRRRHYLELIRDSLDSDRKVAEIHGMVDAYIDRRIGSAGGRADSGAAGV